MEIHVIDTETTGTSGTDQVIQYASITVPDKLKDIKEGLVVTTPEEHNALIAEMGFEKYRARAKSSFFPTFPVNNAYLNHTCAMNPFAFEVHGITPEYLKKYATDTWDNVHLLLPPEGSIIVGHNVKIFDYRMITQHLDEGLKPTFKFLDTLKLVKHIEKIQKGKFGTENYKLLTLVNFFMPEFTTFFGKETHNAISDCEMTLLLLLHLAKSYPFVPTISGLVEELE